jgi:hypothetical protein
MATYEVIYTFFGRERPAFLVTADSPESALEAFKKAKPSVVNINDVREVPKIVNKRGWTPRKRQFFREQYQWLQEVQPIKKPFGRDGKKLQAEWREKNGLDYVDPVQSNLSSWGEVLAKEGYIRKRPDGLWEITDKAWEDN